MLKVKKYNFPTLSVSCCQMYYPYLTCDNLSNQIITQVMLKYSATFVADNTTWKYVPICYGTWITALGLKTILH